MQTFLDEVAVDLWRQYGPAVAEATVVFPNRRAGLFFGRALARAADRPAWTPATYSIGDFATRLTGLTQPDRLSLIFDLFEVYRRATGLDQSFDRFYFWGELLLTDFSDVDAYRIDARQLFINMKDQRAVTVAFPALTEEQLTVVRTFRDHFREPNTRQQVAFLRLWEALPSIYEGFNDRLAARGQAYEGRIFRAAADIVAGGWQPKGPLCFVGFNDLNPSEEEIVSRLVGLGARAYWDVDSYYLDHPAHEAGRSLRRLRRHAVLGPTFPQPPPQRLASPTRETYVVGVPLRVGQAQAAGHFLAQLARQPDFDPADTVVVLPDESLLFPVLHALPAAVGAVNVTMGYPLRHTPLFGLLAHLTALQQSAVEKEMFHYRPVLDLLRHPYVRHTAPDATQARLRALEQLNRPYLSPEAVVGEAPEPLLAHLFRVVRSVPAAFDYLGETLRLVADQVGTDLPGAQPESEYLYQFYTQLQRLREVLERRDVRVGLKTFWKLFRQLTERLRTPFSGEPVRGLQIMGALETRNLDFKNVLVLSLNEGSLPPKATGDSFVPYNLRRAFGLSTAEQAEGRFTYYFYRLLQRAERVYLFYDTEGKGNEVSRLVQQVRLETGWPLREYVLAHPTRPAVPRPISIAKTPAVLARLRRFLVGAPDGQPLTPSAVNRFLDCPLRFYFRHVARLEEPVQIEEEISPATFGNVLHLAMEAQYQALRMRKQLPSHTPLPVEEADFDWLKAQVPDSVTRAFQKHYQDDHFKFEGRNYIVREVMQRFVRQVLFHDATYAPFEVIGLEDMASVVPLSVPGVGEVALRGVLDRVDRKGPLVRVIDYKSGADERSFTSVAALFDTHAPKRNKAALQTLFYGWLYLEQAARAQRATYAATGQAVTVGLYNAREMFDEAFRYELMLDKRPVTDIAPLTSEFRRYLTETVARLFDPAEEFYQTDHEKRCDYCVYRHICHRD